MRIWVYSWTPIAFEKRYFMCHSSLACSVFYWLTGTLIHTSTFSKAQFRICEVHCFDILYFSPIVAWRANWKTKWRNRIFFLHHVFQPLLQRNGLATIEHLFRQIRTTSCSLFLSILLCLGYHNQGVDVKWMHIFWSFSLLTSTPPTEDHSSSYLWIHGCAFSGRR